jgi:pyridoxal 5'-phosphate synthase pdxT subunit
VKRLGILAFQGSVEEHEQMAERSGASTLRVKRPEELGHIDGLIIPGGESSTFIKLLHTSGFYFPLLERISKGLPVLATCAGIILLAQKVVHPEQISMEQLRIKVQRNGYGRQIDSFCEEVSIEGFKEAFRAVFIRAPLILSVDPEVSVLARDHSGHPIYVKDRNITGLTFHPELCGDTRIHRHFISLIP